MPPTNSRGGIKITGIVHLRQVHEKLSEISMDSFAAISVYTFVTKLHLPVWQWNSQRWKNTHTFLQVQKFIQDTGRFTINWLLYDKVFDVYSVYRSRLTSKDYFYCSFFVLSPLLFVNSMRQCITHLLYHIRIHKVN